MKAYLDDLIVGSNSSEDTMGMVKKVFELCREVKVKLHPDKCS